MHRNTWESWWPISPMHEGLYGNADGKYGFENLMAWLRHSWWSKGMFSIVCIAQTGLYTLMTAIYHPFPPRWHIQTHHIWHLASNYQGHIQGPLGHLGWRMAGERTWEGKCCHYNGGHWPEVYTTTIKPCLVSTDRAQRIATVPPFPGLHCFPEGCGFKQWMGDDSKALMKVSEHYGWSNKQN